MEYKKLTDFYAALEKTTKRLEKTMLIAEFLKKAARSELDYLILLLQGKVFPDYDEREINIGTRIVIKALEKSSGSTSLSIEKEWKKIGDLGEVAQKLIGSRKQQTLFSETLKTIKVFNNLKRLAELVGKGTVDKKVGLISELLSSASDKEAKFIIRTLLNDLRIGIGDGSIRDAITWAYFGDKLKISYNKEKNTVEIEDRHEYNKYLDAVQRAYDLTNDFAKVATTAKEKGLDGLGKLSIEIGKPLKVMLALKAKNIQDGFERVGKPAQLEYKYDGFRIQAHCNKGNIKLFTRRLENVTGQFPDIVKVLKTDVKADSCILDSEAVGYSPKTGKYLPFQKISQRIKRKYDIEEISKKFPVELNVFDILYYDGKSTIKQDFQERRKILKKIIKDEKRKIVVASAIVTDDEKQAAEFYDNSLKAGNEGIMMKKLDAPYKPGARVGYMIKVKPTMENMDLVVIKAEWGTGKRASWLSSFTLACIGEDGEFLEIGKVSTGLKEKQEQGISFDQLTELLKPLITNEHGREVHIKPKVVLEVAYEEIQKSPTYSSGFALRFPRFISLRDDRKPENATSLDYIEELYYGQ